MINVNTPISIINQPIKLGRVDGAVFIQANRPPSSLETHASDDLNKFIRLAEATLNPKELHSVKSTMLAVLNETVFIRDFQFLFSELIH